MVRAALIQSRSPANVVPRASIIPPVHGVGSLVNVPDRILATTDPARYSTSMGEHIEQRIVGQPRLSRIRPGKQTPQAMGRRLLEIVVYEKCCRVGATLFLDDLAETSEVGDWKMPDFKMACSYAVSQGWLIVRDDTVTLTTAGLAAA